MDERETSWERVRFQMERAFNRAEVEEAERALRGHLARYPEDVARDPWHGWAEVVRSLEER